MVFITDLIYLNEYKFLAGINYTVGTRGVAKTKRRGGGDGHLPTGHLPNNGTLLMPVNSIGLSSLYFSFPVFQN